MQFFTDTIAEYLSHSTKKTIEAKREDEKAASVAKAKKKFLHLQSTLFTDSFQTIFAAFILSYLYLSTAYELYCKGNFLFLHTLLGNTENLDLLGLFPNNMLQIKKQF